MWTGEMVVMAVPESWRSAQAYVTGTFNGQERPDASVLHIQHARAHSIRHSEHKALHVHCTGISCIPLNLQTSAQTRSRQILPVARLQPGYSPP
jgi:hypothetical protein